MNSIKIITQNDWGNLDLLLENTMLVKENKLIYKRNAISLVIRKCQKSPSLPNNIDIFKLYMIN